MTTSINSFRKSLKAIESNGSKFTRVRTIIAITGNYKFSSTKYVEIRGIASQATLRKFVDEYPNCTISASVFATTKQYNCGGNNYLAEIDIENYLFGELKECRD